MVFPSIRLRLTAWYLASLALGLAVFGIGSWFAMRASAFNTIDEELQDRIQGVDKFMQLQIASLSPAEIRDEFREHSVLGPGGDLFQVCDENGRWLYRSAVLENNRIPIRLPDQLGNRPVYENVEVQNIPIRFATARVVVNNHPYTIQVAAPLHEFYQALERFRLILWLSAPLLLTAAGLGGYWISRRALKPVDQIAAAAESISINNLSDRLSVPRTSDELQRLSLTLNGMLSRLEASIQRISQFTADASHELRAPVSLIRTTAELAAKSGRTNSEYHEDMLQILHEAERMSRLVESLLLLARADSGHESLQLEITDLSTAVREAAEQARSLAAERGIEMETDLELQALAVKGDSEALRRLFFILIDNAIKYNFQRGRVRVEARAIDGQARVTVADTGIGIAESDRDHIFDRFWRVDKARSRGLGGAGLGLAIARWIVGQHDGSIEVQSSVGQGSIFTVNIPLDDMPKRVDAT